MCSPGCSLPAGLPPTARVRRIAEGLTWLFNLPFLRLLGRHSLQIYAWHVVLVYLVFWLDRYYGPFDEFTKTLIAITGVGLLSPAGDLSRTQGRRPGRESAGHRGRRRRAHALASQSRGRQQAP